MYYSIISGLALIINLIINRGYFRQFFVRGGEQKDEQQAAMRYSFFVLVANCFFLTDIIWGVLYEYHESDVLFPFLYSDCVFYFIFMFLRKGDRHEKETLK